MQSSNQQDDGIVSAIQKSDTIEAIVLEKQALDLVPELLGQYFGSKKILLIADKNTMAAAGNRLLEILNQNDVSSEVHVFPVEPYLKSSVENADTIIKKLKAPSVVPVAVGSGVINDLVKYAAFQLNIPYMCVATAASMDGYASAGAPLSQKGFKHTIPCKPPRVIVADLDVISAAPGEMAGWGYGDLCGKIPAGADWIIADTLGIEAIDDLAWPLVQGNLKTWLKDPGGVAEGNTKAIKELCAGLVLSSIAMELHNSSRPASGADHQIAHMWEMDGLSYNGRLISHGTCVALGTLTVLSLYGWLLKQDFSKLEVPEVINRRPSLSDLKAEVKRYFTSPAVADRAIIEVEAKYIDDETLAKRLEFIKKNWPTLKQRLGVFLDAHGKVEQKLMEVGVDISPAAHGISPEYHKKTLVASRLIRRRYTVLDFLGDTGCFDQAVESLFPEV